ICVAALLIAADQQTTAPAIGINIDVHPSIADEYQLLKRPTPNTYTCLAIVFDAQSKKALTGFGRLVVAPGKSESARSTGGEYDVEFTVKINPATNVNAPADRADAHVTVRHNDVIVAEQRSTIA